MLGNPRAAYRYFTLAINPYTDPAPDLTAYHHYALAALGPRGVDHLVDLLRRDLVANMGQLGMADLGQTPKPFPLD